jgi:hypothetical protein
LLLLWQQLIPEIQGARIGINLSTLNPDIVGEKDWFDDFIERVMRGAGQEEKETLRWANSDYLENADHPSFASWRSLPPLQSSYLHPKMIFTHFKAEGDANDWGGARLALTVDLEEGR